MPDLQGDVAIVTGGNTGIGKETCKVYMVLLLFALNGISEAWVWRLGTPKKERESLSCREERAEGSRGNRRAREGDGKEGSLSPP